MYIQNDYINETQNNLENQENTNSKNSMAPLVTSQVSSSSESISTILSNFNNEIVCIPEYQRDSDQWSDRKKSLFIDSILNNITVPSLIYANHTRKHEEFWVKRYEVVDGQQRISLLSDFKNNKFKMLPPHKLNYLSENSVHYANRTFDDLPLMFKRIFENYKISIIYLPEDMSKSVKLETFRRLNQQPYTLSAQDIRLSQYSYSKISNFLRVAGIFDTRTGGSLRMLKFAEQYGIEWPWKNYHEDIQKAWFSWWQGKASNLGQKASEMILWYIIGIYHNNINDLLSNSNYMAKSLNMSFVDQIDNVADIMLAHLNYEENKDLKTVCSIDELQKDIFPKFVKWFKFFNDNFPATFNVQRSRLIGFIFAALYNYKPQSLQEKQLNLIDRFLSKPRETSSELGISYPESKGRWKTSKGLYNQIVSIHKIIHKIMG
ncbi:MAG: DUF262 domain-containing protein [Bacteroidales bacterium]